MSADAVPSASSDPTADFTPVGAEADDAVLEEWLRHWQSEAAQGRHITFADLYRDRPDLAKRLQQRIDAFRSLHEFLHVDDQAPAPTTQFRDGAALPGSDGAGATALAPPGYEILAVLGHGGMGTVYKARQIQADRVVALKRIKGRAEEADVARFRTEAAAVARLSHPHIVQIYEVGTHDGLPFFSMEYCPGGGLEKKLAGTPLPPRQAAELAETLSRAVDAAHQKGILHRDLKPANVLLDAAGQPKVSDFGLAKKVDDDSGQTQSGAILGTPAYMAPEQAAGKTKEVGPAADVYALGAILYECLTGRPPFRGATMIDTLLMVRIQEPVSPSQLQRGIPRDLETICLRCLAKEPGKRYASAAELADDLGRFLRGETIRARPVGRVGRTWRWCRRNPAVAGLLAMVAMVLVLGATVSMVFAFRARDKAAEADRERQRTEMALGDLQKKSEEVQKQKDEVQKQLEVTEVVGYSARLHEAQNTLKRGQLSEVQEVLRDCDPKRCGWEYDFLLRQTFPRFELFGHTGHVNSVAFSPDGKRLVTAGKDGTVKVWEAATGQEVLTLRVHHDEVFCAVFSPDGTWLASGGGSPGQPFDDPRGTTLKLWDAATGKETMSFKGHTKTVLSVVFSPDGKRLASASEDNTVRVWDAVTGENTLTFKGHNKLIRNVSFSPDGKLLASASSDQTVKVWDATTGEVTLTFKGHTEWVSSVAFRPDGKQLASASWDGTVRVCDAATGEQIHMLQRNKKTVTHVAYSPDGKWLASGSVPSANLLRTSISRSTPRTSAGATRSTTPSGIQQVRTSAHCPSFNSVSVATLCPTAQSRSLRNWRSATRSSGSSLSRLRRSGRGTKQPLVATSSWAWKA